MGYEPKESEGSRGHQQAKSATDKYLHWGMLPQQEVAAPYDPKDFESAACLTQSHAQKTALSSSTSGLLAVCTWSLFTGISVGIQAGTIHSQSTLIFIILCPLSRQSPMLCLAWLNNIHLACIQCHVFHVSYFFCLVSLLKDPVSRHPRVVSFSVPGPSRCFD